MRRAPFGSGFCVVLKCNDFEIYSSLIKASYFSRCEYHFVYAAVILYGSALRAGVLFGTLYTIN
jgi:hypothetical protein